MSDRNHDLRFRCSRQVGQALQNLVASDMYEIFRPGAFLPGGMTICKLILSHFRVFAFSACGISSECENSGWCICSSVESPTCQSISRRYLVRPRRLAQTFELTALALAESLHSKSGADEHHLKVRIWPSSSLNLNPSSCPSPQGLVRVQILIYVFSSRGAK